MQSKIRKYAPQCFTCLCLLVFIASMFINKGYFEPITHESVVLYECRQVFAIMLLYAIGYLFLYFSANGMDPLLRTLYAFPIGLCLWVFVSYISLLCGIPYTMWGTLLMVAVVLAIAFGIGRRFDINTFHSLVENHALQLHMIVLGIAMLCSTGFLYVMISYDSLFYFINYGRALTVLKGFQAFAGTNSFTLTNITQFLPLVCSYTAFWGLDQAYQVQAFLACNVVAAFGVGCYRLAYSKKPFEDTDPLANKREHATNQRAIGFAILLSTVLATSTCYLVLSGWFLANMPCMVFIFLFYLATVLCRQKDLPISTGSMLIGFCLASLALLRKDGVIYDAFFIVWMCSIELFSKKRMIALFAPAVALTLSWLAYVRLGVSVSVGRGYYSSIANNKNIVLVGSVIVGSYLFIVIGHPVLKWICSHLRFIHEFDFMYLAFASGLLYVLNLHPDITSDDWDYAIRNLILFPSSWGISAILFGFLIILSFTVCTTLRSDHFVWIGYALLNLISYCYVDNKIFWVNWDDSYNRVLMQIVPVMLFVVGRSFLDKETLLHE